MRSQAAVHHLVLLSLAAAGAACGAETRTCAGLACAVDGSIAPACEPGVEEPCYTGPSGSAGVGVCRAGTRSCDPSGQWRACAGEVVPGPEVCGNGVDDNCSGAVDEDVDLDGDGFSTCAGDCCDSGSCGTPGLINPGAYDVAGNSVDDDCDGAVDNTLATCADGITSDTTDGLAFARSLELCTTAEPDGARWGVISARLLRPSGGQVLVAEGHAVRPAFGVNTPRAGASLAVFSTGRAAAPGDVAPTFVPMLSTGHCYGPGLGCPVPDGGFGVPADFLAAHAGTLPNAPGCPPPRDDKARDGSMLELVVRVPTNARSLALDANFFTTEYPPWTCSPYNDMFVALLDSTYAGPSPNPPDKNIAQYFDPAGQAYPLGVNLVHGDTGVFRQCQNGLIGCWDEQPEMVTRCEGTDGLVGTGYDLHYEDTCFPGSLAGGATDWLAIRGNVVGGEVITLRLAIWDTADTLNDSLVLLDHFRWSTEASAPGVVVQ
ncbi:MAG: hypothetical protein KBG28_00575 [Kofleriaceae bacterium]|nr:hypothetical protein [Kofleriaceae bacterium]